MFVGIGGYLSGLALIQFKGSALLIVLLPLAVLIPGLIAFGLGLILFRGRRETGPYFALITLASSLGGHSSLICTPATMTHRGMPPEAQAQAGITPDLLRLSVGIEAVDDVIADLARGLAVI